MQPLFAGLFGLGAPEIMVLGILGVLLFGKRLPDVGRYLGKSITEFRKGMKGLEDDFEGGMSGSHAGRPETNVSAEPLRPPQRVTTNAPKFEDAPPAPASNQQFHS